MLASAFALNMQLVAQGWLVYAMTSSAINLTWVTLSFMLPQVVFSLLGGVLADRVRKKPLIGWTPVINGVATIMMFLLIDPYLAGLTDDVVGGFRIPAGSIVLTSPYVTHRHPDYWTGPARFDPDRFDAAHEVDRPPFAYFPFGGGPRQCIGNTFAMMELVLVVSTIAQRCRLDSTGPHDLGRSPAITLRAATPITMRVSRRAAALA